MIYLTKNMKSRGMVEYMKLNDKELKQITGGVSVWVVIGAIAGLIFGVGAIDGYARPPRCRR